MAKIARQSGISLGALMAANRSVNPDRISVGQKLALPGGRSEAITTPPRSQPTSAVRETVTTGGGTYTVRKGDTLSKIARDNGTSVAMLQKLNNHKNVNNLAVGRTLTLPGSSRTTSRPVRDEHPLVDITPPGPRESRPAPRSESASGNGNADTISHMVRRRETTSTIARQYGITWAELARANKNIDPNHLTPGQMIRIPVAQTVRNGPVDQEAIPLRESTRPAEPRTHVETMSPLETNRTVSMSGQRLAVKVAEGDSLESLAKEFHTTPAEIRRMNQNISGFDQNVVPGNFVVIPWETPQATKGALPYRQA